MPSQTLRLSLVGFGKVGRAFAELILREHDRVETETGFNLVVTGICTSRFGAVTDPSGVDLVRALELASAGGVHGPSVESTEYASSCPADIVVETTPLEPFTGTVGIAIIRAALSADKSVASCLPVRGRITVCSDPKCCCRYLTFRQGPSTTMATPDLSAHASWRS